MKPQNWIIGSQNSNTEDRTDLQANQAWNPLEILKAGILNGMLKKDSEQLKIISDEICNFLTSAGKTPDPNDSTQMSEVYNDIKAELADVVTKTFSFKGYVGQTAPSSSTYTLNIGDMWINSANMPTTIPVSASDINIWDGTAWISATNSYTPVTFDTFSNLENNEGYYWFGGEWKIISTDLSLDYFSLNTTTGKWEIKSNVNLPGNPTTTTPESTDNSTKIATTAFIKSLLGSYALLASPAFTGNPTAPTQTAGNNSTRLATTEFVATAVSSATSNNLKPGTIIPYGGSSVPTGYLQCNGAAVSRTTYSALFSAIGTTWGTGNGSTTFNLPNFNNVYLPTSYSLTVAIKGNGKTLGFTEGTSNGGLIVGKYMNGVNSAGGTVIHQLAYNTNVGTNANLGTTGFYDGSNSNQNTLFNVVKTVGMTTDSDNSGLTGTTSISRMTTQKWIIKY